MGRFLSPRGSRVGHGVLGLHPCFLTLDVLLDDAATIQASSVSRKECLFSIQSALIA